MQAEKYRARGARWQVELRSAIELMHRQRLGRQIDRLNAQLEELGQPRGLWERCEVNRLRKRVAQLTAELNAPLIVDSTRLTIH